MIKRSALLALLAISAHQTPALAADKEDVCVRYETEDGWSKGYKVQATFRTGSELNLAVGSLSRFRTLSTYAVIFWDEGEATILELPATALGSAPLIETQVEDQTGRKWKIKEGHLFCH